MKKAFASVLTGALVTTVWIGGDSIPVHAEKESSPIMTQQTKGESEEARRGLLGYYFKGSHFNNLVTFAPTHEDTLMYNPATSNELLEKDQQVYQSIRWVGFIKSKETGNFTFNLSDDEHAIIEIDGKVISNQGQEKKQIHVKKDTLIPIKIEYKPDTQLRTDTKLFQNLKLYKIDEKENMIPIEKEDLRNPDFNAAKSSNTKKKSSKTTLFEEISKGNDDPDIDTDGDSIIDVWEENGYTIQNRIAVKWSDDLESKGYTKFVSNPLNSHTVGDPYTDYEKAARDLDKSNAKETFNPLVAAFPSVNVGLEKIVLSPNMDLTNSVGSSTSNNWSYTNTEGASVEGGIGPEGISFGVSANYSHSETVGAEWGHSTDDTSHLNSAESAYINANVRYNNVGTGSIYNVKPSTSFVLNDTTIGTIQAGQNATAQSISPGESYPQKGQHGIAINTMDDFDSRPIPLNKDQLTAFLNNNPILLETDQVDGEYMIVNEAGSLIPGGSWNGVMEQIKKQTSSIIIDTGEKVSEKRIAAKNYDDPEDKTPSVSLKEALKLGYPEDIKEKDGLLYYQDQPMYESSVMAYLDENTAKEVKEQINDTTGKFKDVENLYDVKLEPEMNFTIKLATLFDTADRDNSIGTWYCTERIPGGITGHGEYRSSDLRASLQLEQTAKDKLQKDNSYYLSMYMKADADVETKIDIQGEFDNTIKSKKVKLNNKGYQRVDVLIENTDALSIDQIAIVGDGKTNVYWADVSVTEVTAIQPSSLLFETSFIVPKVNGNSAITFTEDGIFISENKGAVYQGWTPVYDMEKQAYQLRSFYAEGYFALSLKSESSRIIEAVEHDKSQDEQYWLLEKLDDEYYVIKNKKYPHLVLEVEEGNPSNDTKIIANERSDISAQAFKIEPHQ
ncbi:hypothetical protein COD21_31460 [Bacillus cereus]|uniref:binary toxin-like calcium binding domain-containing protein n=1 Tax=Bacillus cereus TaxID=1396 RepID=UPI000BFC81A6|nr:binary toxin-like calcium binding domain-containing protein [Bacillus cereus]PGT99132.1 hypothetical protein COD21_31460 [Bacillus cereus]